MSIYLKLQPIHRECNTRMTREGKADYDILICSKCEKRMVVANMDLNEKEIIDNKLILI